ncbi:MAG: methyl-accepting chemotaxis protein [Haloarculaceae archaeon]
MDESTPGAGGDDVQTSPGGNSEDATTAYKGVIEQAAEGDLSQRMDPDRATGETAELAVAFNQLMDNFEATVHEAKGATERAVSDSGSVVTRAEELEETFINVTERLDEISKGGEQQIHNLDAVLERTNGLRTAVEESDEAIDDIAETAREASKAGQSGRQATERAVMAMAEMERTTKETTSQITQLETEVEAIEEVITLITEIADKTNMLALNASIEAARASESGEGFSVVAEEIKALSEETKEATAEIEASLARLRETTRETTSNARSVNETVAEGTRTVEDAISALERITAHVEDIDSELQHVSTIIEEQTEAVDETVAIVDVVRDIGGGNQNRVEQAQSLGNDQREIAQNVTSRAAELSRELSDLSTVLDGWETNRSYRPSTPKQPQKK